MIKKAGIFVVSAGFLVYFISPAEEEQKPPPAKIEAPQKAVSSTDEEADYWGGEEYGEGDNEQEFVTGEPMVSTEPVSATGYTSDGEDGAGDDREDAAKSVPASEPPSPRATKNRRIHSSSPKPGELGSAENPIPLN